MDTGFVDDHVVISRPNLPVFPVFFPVIRKFEFGDWFESDCILSQSGLCNFAVNAPLEMLRGYLFSLAASIS